MKRRVVDCANIAIYNTLPRLLARNADVMPQAVAMVELMGEHQREITWAGLHDRARRLSLGLGALGLSRGDVVALVGANRSDWVAALVGAQAQGAQVLGLDPGLPPDAITALVSQAGAKFIFLWREANSELAASLGGLDCVSRVIMAGDASGRMLTLNALADAGRRIVAEQPVLYDIDMARRKGGDVGFLCALPAHTKLLQAEPLRIVRFRSAPLLARASALVQAAPRAPQELYFSLNPLGGAQELVSGLCANMVARSTLAVAPLGSGDALDMLRILRPMHLTARPRLWEEIAALSQVRLAGTTGLRREIQNQAIRQAEQALTTHDRAGWADIMVFSRLKRRFGLERLVSGFVTGGPLAPETLRFLRMTGIPLYQNYGAALAGGPVTAHRPDDVAFDSAGTALDGLTLRIDNANAVAIGKIMVRNDGVCAGPLGGETLEAGDWITTGDAGLMDDKGHLVVVDRVEDIGAAARGKRYAPKLLESRLRASPYIGDALVIGRSAQWPRKEEPDDDGLAALVWLRASSIGLWALEHGLEGATPATLADTPAVHRLIKREIARINDGLAAVHRIERFRILPAHDRATPDTLTLEHAFDRRQLIEHYSHHIQALMTRPPDAREAG
jgi:long-chain acyl-CoA synthetase